MTKRYWVQVEGAKIYRKTKREIEHLAQAMADATGRALQVGYDEVKALGGGPLRRNPDPGHFLAYWRENERGKAARREYLAATKARRLAKTLRDRQPGAVKREAAAFKTGKFLVEAKGGPRGSYFNLARPTRAAADALADEFRAAGYNVTVSPL